MFLSKVASFFHYHIAGVVSVSTQEKMRWIDTASNIASVEYMHSCGDVAILHFPGKAMGIDFRISLGELPVSIAV
jgi:hypothetical protein